MQILPDDDATLENKNEVWSMEQISLNQQPLRRETITFTRRPTAEPQDAWPNNLPNLTEIMIAISSSTLKAPYFSVAGTSSKWFGKLTPQFVLEAQEEGGFVAYSNEYSGAVGQGETEDEAIQDLEEAILSLKEFLEEEKKQSKITK